MKKMIVSTKHLMILAMMMVMTISANAMSYNAQRTRLFSSLTRWLTSSTSRLHSMRQSMRSTSTT